MYAAYLNLDNKHPVMALHEYCTARQWEPPFFHLTERPCDNKKQKVFTAAVSCRSEASGALVVRISIEFRRIVPGGRLWFN